MKIGNGDLTLKNYWKDKKIHFLIEIAHIEICSKIGCKHMYYLVLFNFGLVYITEPKIKKP